MRIVIFSESEMWGGLEAHAATFAEFLVTTGHEVVIVCLGARAYDLYRQAAPDGVTLVKVIPPVHRSVWNWWRSLRHIKADAAVLEKGTLRSGGLALDCVLKLKYRRYVAIQQLEPPDLPPRTSRRHLGGLVPGIGLWWYRWKWSGWARSLAPDVTVCVSDSVRRRLASDYAFAERKLVTIHNGVDPSKFELDPEVRRQVRTAWGVPDDATVFGSVGRLSPQKGLDVAIEAFGLTVRNNPGHRMYLVLVGEGTERSALMQKSRSLGLDQLVMLPGFTPTPRNSYQGLDFFLIPSRFEGLPFSLVEAMASGCPVIGTSVGGIPEVITDPTMGTLVPPEDPVALAEAMCHALHRDPAVRAAERLKARQRALDSFDIRALCTRIASLLRQPRELRPHLPERQVGAPPGLNP